MAVENGTGSVSEEEVANRWTAKRRSALVLSLLRGETSAQEAARQHGLTVAEIEEWKERFLAGAENALRSKPRFWPPPLFCHYWRVQIGVADAGDISFQNTEGRVMTDYS